MPLSSFKSRGDFSIIIKWISPKNERTICLTGFTFVWMFDYMRSYFNKRDYKKLVKVYLGIEI